MKPGAEPQIIDEIFLSARERLRGANIRPTKPRLCVLEAMEAQPGPISANDVFLMLSRRTRLSVSTIYRVLRDLEAAGLVMGEWVAGVCGAKTVYSTTYTVAAVTDSPYCSHQISCRNCGHKSAFQDAALLEQLRRFVGPARDDERQNYATIELDGCHKCRRENHPTTGIRPLSSQQDQKPTPGRQRVRPQTSAR